jgi:hypothetical protein
MVLFDPPCKADVVVLLPLVTDLLVVLLVPLRVLLLPLPPPLLALKLWLHLLLPLTSPTSLRLS